MQLSKMIEKGLSSAERQTDIHFADSLDDIKRIISAVQTE